MTLAHTFAAISDKGRERAQNEDYWFRIEEPLCYGVVDGMGGRPEGALAARMAAESLTALFRQNLQRGRREAIGTTSGVRETLLQLNGAFLAALQTRPDLSGMGATLVIALVLGGSVIVANWGDCRAYLLREGVFSCLTQDHTVAAQLLRAGLISEEEARTNPSHHQITGAIGIVEAVAPWVCECELRSGDRLLLCSDGLWNMASAETLQEVWSLAKEPEAACQMLLSAALEGGGRDNITIIAIHFDSENEDTAEMEPLGLDTLRDS